MRSSTEETAADNYDTGDRKAVADREKLAKVREEKRINGLKLTMATSDGRRWMWAFLSNCGLFSVEFNGNSKDYYNLGRRGAGMPVMAEIQKHCMDEYILMARENANV
ncbi:hypothetical protein LT85_1022 [Collimonas arenae]|uniref:Phage protein n=1 Tax=Collimonas arenae TaxID=279058 RepID=A0A0A1F8T6_9BURK|nr:hypothetical protein [Collimonas arenae]AIY40180.1 hypothetical protein LT85_1022 [Collimonas arenae]